MSTELAMPGLPDGATASMQERLRALGARAREPGIASFFFYDARLHSIAVKALPGEYYVGDSDEVVIMTTLGSCIAVCLWDRVARVGGLNHFMLPEAAGDRDGGRYGACAMQRLVDAMLERGASRASMQAKVFGGCRAIAGTSVLLSVGERNARFAFDYLSSARIPVVGKDVLDVYPRKVCYLPASGEAMVKRLPPSAAPSVAEIERQAAHRLNVAAGGSIDSVLSGDA